MSLSLQRCIASAFSVLGSAAFDTAGIAIQSKSWAEPSANSVSKKEAETGMAQGTVVSALLGLRKTMSLSLKSRCREFLSQCAGPVVRKRSALASLSSWAKVVFVLALLWVAGPVAHADEIGCGAFCQPTGSLTLTFTQYFDYPFLSGTPEAQWVLTLDASEISAEAATLGFTSTRIDLPLTPTFVNQDFINDGIQLFDLSVPPNRMLKK